MSQKQQKLKVTIHAFGLFRDPSSGSYMIPTWDTRGQWNKVIWLGTNIRMPLRSFRDNFEFREKWTNGGCLEAFRGKANGFNPPRNITSHIGTPNNVSGEKNDEGRRSPNMSQKQPKLKVIIHAFGLSRDPRSGCHGIPPWDMRDHWKGVIWLGLNIWIPIRSFRDNFGLHEKWTNGMFRGFSKQCKWGQTPAKCYKSRRHS